MTENLLELAKIKEEKRKCILECSYEKAALLRDKEKKILHNIWEEKEPEYINYINEKIKEFGELSKDKKCKQAVELFEYAVKKLIVSAPLTIDYKSSLTKEMDWLKTVNVLKAIDDDIKNNEVLNKWIFENIISFEQWFGNNYVV